MKTLALHRLHGSARELAARSSSWRETSVPRLSLAIPTDDAIVLGSFQRPSEVGDRTAPLVRRGSGGCAVRVGPESVWLSLALPRVDALVACSADKIINRYVRPLLRALTRVTSVPASYFGRDWLSMGHRPVGLVAFAHDASMNRALFEAVIAVGAPYALDERASFLGKVPATLSELAGRSLAVDDVVTSIVDGYRDLAAIDVRSPEASPDDIDVADDPPWTASRSEAIGAVAAGRDANGALRVGGELMASSDAITKLEASLTGLRAGVSPNEIGGLVDEAFTTGGAVIFGLKSLTTIRDVVVDALAARR